MSKFVAMVIAVVLATAVAPVPVEASADGDIDSDRLFLGAVSEEFLAAYATLAAKPGPLVRSDLALLGPDPALSFVFGRSSVEVYLWQQMAKRLAPESIDSAALQLEPEVAYVEAEGTATGANDLVSSAEAIAGFGTAAQLLNRARISGTTVVEQPDVNIVGQASEEDGSIPDATAVFVPVSESVSYTGVIGDADRASDVDFFAVPLEKGQTLSASLVSGFDEPVLLIADEDGDLLEFGSPNIATKVRATGTYFVMVSTCCAFPTDPFDPDSIEDEGQQQQGDYVLTLGIDDFTSQTDKDFYAVELQAGDVMSVGAAGTAATVVIRPPTGELQRSGETGSSYYPESSPLRHQGEIGADIVAATTGRYIVGIFGSKPGDYKAELRVYRPGLSTADANATQVLFLDFDGATVDTRRWGGPFSDATALTGLPDFMFRWGLDPADSDAVIDGVVAAFRGHLSAELKAGGINGDRAASGIAGEHDVEIRNSRDHTDTWGDPNVSRIVIGGSAAELGIPTIGIAASIDPGNFDQSETAVVLLDELSTSQRERDSLNSVELAEGVSMVDLVADTIATIAAHEAGHILGAWHTDSNNELGTIMDEGGNLRNHIGIGPDDVWGTADDADVVFATDHYSRSEGFRGRQNTPARMSFALATGSATSPNGDQNKAPCTITGTEGSDDLVGTAGDDVICGLGGDDTLRGFGGRDIIRGGAGNDTIYGGPGRDVLYGNQGDDRIYGNAGNDRLIGGNGNDVLDGGRGRDKLKD